MIMIHAQPRQATVVGGVLEGRRLSGHLQGPGGGRHGIGTGRCVALDFRFVCSVSLLGPSHLIDLIPFPNQYTAAIFFSVYETMKGALEPAADAGYAPLVHMAAASVGETVRGRVCVWMMTCKCSQPSN